MGADVKSYVSFSLREVHPLTSSKDYGQGNGAKGLSSFRDGQRFTVLSEKARVSYHFSMALTKTTSSPQLFQDHEC